MSKELKQNSIISSMKSQNPSSHNLAQNTNNSNSNLTSNTHSNSSSNKDNWQCHICNTINRLPIYQCKSKHLILNFYLCLECGKVHNNIKEYLERQSKKPNQISSPTNSDAPNNIFNNANDRNKVVSKEKNRNLHKNSPENEPSVNNYVKTSTKKSNESVNTDNTSCLCQKINDDKLFENNICKLCHKSVMERSLKKNQVVNQVAQMNHHPVKTDDSEQKEYKAQVNNFINRPPSKDNHQPTSIKKVDSKQQFDYTK